MHFTNFILPLTLVVAAAAEPVQGSVALPNGLQFAQQYRREAGNGLSARQSLDPETLCGKGYDDCGDGWCCSEGTKCAGTLTEYKIPVCKDPTETSGPLKGTSPALPYKDPLSAYQSLSSVLAKMTGLPTDPETRQTTTTAAGTGQTKAAAATGSSSPGAAPMNTPGSFGQVGGAIVGVWTVGALAGAGWFLMV